MGTSVDVLVPVSAGGLVRRVEALFSSWHATLTRFSPDSELSRLNASAGRPVRVSDLLLEVADAALGAAAETNGIFDPTLLHEINALGYDRTFDEVRSRDASSAASTTPAGSRTRGWPDVRVDRTRRTITLPTGLGLDLGGIAKGMAVDAALALLAGAGCQTAAVDAGGDLAVIGSTGTGWPLRVELPSGWRTISIVGGALATSGISRRRWRMGDAQMHHLLDPRTGAPAVTDLWSVTVAAGTCREAEVASTTAFVLGPDAGVPWLAERGRDGLFVFQDGRQIEAGPWATHAAAMSAD
jgi:thiamine biosynthesis lipoprotein